MEEESEKQINKQIYIWLLILILIPILFFGVEVLTNGETLRSVFHYVDFMDDGNSGVMDAFTDYSNCLRDALNQPYDNHSLYPPLANIIFKVFAKLTLFKERDSYSIYFMQVVLGMIMMVSISILGICLCMSRILKLYRSDRQLLKLLIIVAIILSTPILFVIERGNILIVSLMLSFVFIAFYNDDNKLFKEMSYIALALAFAIKLYPAVLGILLIRKKDWKGAIKTSVYGLIFLLLPFLCFDGAASIKNWVDSLKFFSEDVDAWGYGYDISLYSILKMFSILAGFTLTDRLWLISRVIVYICLGTSLFVFKDRWKVVLSAVLLLIFVPKASYYYTASFLWLPIVLLIEKLSDDDKFSYKDILYQILLTIIIVPWPLPLIGKFYQWPLVMSWTYVVYDSALLLLTLLIAVDSIGSIYIKVKENDKWKKRLLQ